MDEDKDCAEKRSCLKRDKEQFEKAVASIANLEQPGSGHKSDGIVDDSSANTSGSDWAMVNGA